MKDELLLQNLAEMRADIKELSHAVAKMNTSLEVWKTNVHFGSKMIVGVGGTISTAVSAAITWFIHHYGRANS